MLGNPFAGLSVIFIPSICCSLVALVGAGFCPRWGGGDSALGGAAFLQESLSSMVWRHVHGDRQFMPYIIYIINKVYADSPAISPFLCTAFSLFS